jgi:hypothetical protein
MMELIAHGSLPKEQIEVFEKERAVIEAEVEEMQNQGLELVIGKLEMTAIKALDLPKVDLFRGCDPYVVAYLDSSDRVSLNPKFQFLGVVIPTSSRISIAPTGQNSQS